MMKRPFQNLAMGWMRDDREGREAGRTVGKPAGLVSPSARADAAIRCGAQNCGGPDMGAGGAVGCGRPNWKSAQTTPSVAKM